MKMYYTIIVLSVLRAMPIFAQEIQQEAQQKAQPESRFEYDIYINSRIHGYTVERVQTELKKYKADNFDDDEYSITKALLLFRLSLLSFDEQYTLSAFEYWQRLYALEQYHNPMHLTYIGTLEAMHGGAITTPQPTKKIAWANNGMKKIQQGVDALLKTDNTIAIAYAYFLQGTTFSSLPDFFKEFALTPKSLKQALVYFGKYRKELKKSPDESLNAMTLYLVSSVYFSFGDYALKDGKVSKAIKYYRTCKKYLKGIDDFGSMLETQTDTKISQLTG